MFSLYTFCQTAHRHLYSHSQRYKISVDIVIISPGYSSCQTTNKYVYMIYYTRQVWILYLPSVQLCQTAHTHIHLYILYERSVHTVFALCTVLSNSSHSNTFVHSLREKCAYCICSLYSSVKQLAHICTVLTIQERSGYCIILPSVQFLPKQGRGKEEGGAFNIYSLFFIYF